MSDHERFSEIAWSVTDGLEEAIEAATHLTATDRAAVEAARHLARRIDAEDHLRELALDYSREHQTKPPSVDNVSLPTFLRYCSELGLTPAGRKALEGKKAEGAGRGTSGVSGRRAAAKHLRSA